MLLLRKRDAALVEPAHTAGESAAASATVSESCVPDR